MAYNSQVRIDEQIKMENIQLILARLLDRDNDGNVTPAELAEFFLDIWDVPEARMKINQVSRPMKADENDSKMYLLIQQICKELSLDYYYEIIKSKGMTTKMFLNATFEGLKAAFKEIDQEHISLLYMKA